MSEFKLVQHPTMDGKDVNPLKGSGVSGSLEPLTMQRVDKMLKDISLETFIACGGNKAQWKQWWSKRNDININSNDR